MGPVGMAGEPGVAGEDGSQGPAVMHFYKFLAGFGVC